MSDVRDLLEQLDRLYAFFSTREPKDLYAELHWFLESVQQDPRTRAVFRELVGEAAHALERARTRDEAGAREVALVGADIVRAFPHLDDRAADGDGGEELSPWAETTSLVHFDKLLAGGSGVSFSLLPVDNEDDTLTSELVEILRARLARLPEADESAAPKRALTRRLDEVEAAHTHRRREWQIFCRTSPAASALRALGIVRFLNPEPVVAAPSQDWLARLQRSTRETFHPFAGLRTATFDDAKAPELLERDAAMLALIRSEARRLYEEIRRRVLVRRSHRELVVRCAEGIRLYQRDEVHARAMRAPRRTEEALTQELARQLFDGGLYPMTLGNVGIPSPDPLDPSVPWSFYVEAKQYRGSRAPRVIRAAIEQIVATLARLRGMPSPVRDAFLVIFRVGGPRVELPSEVVRDGVTVSLILVDLSPSTVKDTRRNAQTVVVSARDLARRA